jgi:hypothetical protein
MAKAQAKKTLQQFDEELKQLHISGQWLYEGLLTQCIGGPGQEVMHLSGPGRW